MDFDLAMVIWRDNDLQAACSCRLVFLGDVALGWRSAHRWRNLPDFKAYSVCTRDESLAVWLGCGSEISLDIDVAHSR